MEEEIIYQKRIALAGLGFLVISWGATIYNYAHDCFTRRTPVQQISAVYQDKTDTLDRLKIRTGRN